ncbi:MAG: RcnB family protein [Saezia sp.]
MNFKTITCGIIALSILGSSVAFARPGPSRDRAPGHGQQAYQHRDKHHVQRPRHRSYEHRPSYRHQEYRPHHYSRPAAHYRRGDRIPHYYRGDSYRVHYWSSYGLHRPPTGHYWAHIDGDFVLIAAATGIITSIILNY